MLTHRFRWGFSIGPEGRLSGSSSEIKFEKLTVVGLIYGFQLIFDGFVPSVELLGVVELLVEL